MEALASEHSDRLLVLDELAQIEDRDAAEAAYLLGNGSGRERADQRGKGVPTASWRLVFISSGEITLQEKIDAASAFPITGNFGEFRALTAVSLLVMMEPRGASSREALATLRGGNGHAPWGLCRREAAR